MNREKLTDVLKPKILIMSFEIFLLVYFGIVASGTLAVTGWYFISRGEEIILEDGSKKRVGKIFKGWYFFWTRTKPLPKRVYFDEAHLFELFVKIKAKFMITRDQYDIVQEGVILKISQAQKWYEEMRWIEGAYGIKFFDKGGGDYSVYKEYDEYVYPFWIRDPIAVCATCFSSIYGSAFFWLLIALVKIPMFAWSGTPWLAAVFFWISFCFSLAVLNTALAKRFN